MWSPVVTGPVPLGQSQTVGLKMAEKGLRNQLNHSRVETLLDVAKIGKYPPVNSWLLLVETPFLLVIYVIYNVCRWKSCLLMVNFHFCRWNPSIAGETRLFLPERIRRWQRWFLRDASKTPVIQELLSWGYHVPMTAIAHSWVAFGLIFRTLQFEDEFLVSTLDWAIWKKEDPWVSHKLVE